MDIHEAFKIGAKELAKAQCEYTDLHKGHGIAEADWALVTQKENWTQEQARQMKTLLSGVTEVAMTIAGMPPIPLPGHYVAAVIAKCVSPVNRMIACMKAPDTFDADLASGIMQSHEVKPMSREQLMALVLLYSADYDGEPAAHKLPREVKETMKKENAK